ncbi:hypothetical protein OPIT5_01620 [Opitutaceae bacterium TAV5]|nr:hypothetical protein OPIT5_01620 [Opitutaceae bacterium TAV5]
MAMIKATGISLIILTVILGAILQRKGLLYAQREPPQIISHTEVRDDDDTVVHITTASAHTLEFRWPTAVLVILLISGVACVIHSWYHSHNSDQK